MFDFNTLPLSKKLLPHFFFDQVSSRRWQRTRERRERRPIQPPSTHWKVWRFFRHLSLFFSHLVP
jgi:hypothetical protein